MKVATRPDISRSLLIGPLRAVSCERVITNMAVVTELSPSDIGIGTKVTTTVIPPVSKSPNACAIISPSGKILGLNTMKDEVKN